MAEGNFTKARIEAYLGRAYIYDEIKLANDGYSETLRKDSNFLAGLNVHKGQVTYKAVADAFGHTYNDAKELLN